MTRLITLTCCLLLSVAGASAQAPAGGSGVANSGMEQGEAVVAVRSDVRLAIKGIRATLSDRLAALTSEVTTRMPHVRGCYAKLVATRPATVGGVRAVVVLEPGRVAPGIELTELDGSDAELTNCIGKVLRGLDLRKVERPAAAEITLTFANTRAHGQSVMEQRQADFQADVARNDDGSFVGRWETEGGGVAFEVSARGDEGESITRRLLLGLRGGFSGFLDCRRRAGRKGMDPTGELDVAVRIAPDGKVEGRVTRTAIQDEQRTPGCVEKAIRQVRLERTRRAATATLTVRFQP